MAKRILTEARNATRVNGKFAKMPKCENCGRPGTLEPNYERYAGPGVK